ncbi:aldose 1-epimerase [Sphingomonas cavernae]|uniref:aldose 1-epimerase n=1 Tax=Sphingomonas cavernae TaxID=2320861 RepID=UPI0015FF5282|nr:aldose 1-epimerase [Sphingomonas cavernae]
MKPELGGAVTGLHYRGHSVLRACDAAIDNVLDSACFPLLPYANRIARGRFVLEGREVRVPLNFGSHPHALHGVGWQAQWDVVDQDPVSVLMRHEHDGGPAWPWRYRAEQRITLGDDGVDFTLSLENLDDTAMPAGLGFHPAFPLSDHTRLRAALGAVWLADDDCLPTHRAAPDHFADWRSRPRVRRETLVDHCHEAWERSLDITDAGMTIRMTASAGLDWLHVFIPPNCDYFCVEPVNHMPDALNRPEEEMPMLRPGECGTVSMRIAVERL